jgi:hypothetical protein
LSLGYSDGGVSDVDLWELVAQRLSQTRNGFVRNVLPQRSEPYDVVKERPDMSAYVDAVGVVAQDKGEQQRHSLVVEPVTPQRRVPSLMKHSPQRSQPVAQIAIQPHKQIVVRYASAANGVLAKNRLEAFGSGSCPAQHGLERAPAFVPTR